MERSELILELFLRFNRRLEGITRRLQPKLHINVNHLLTELDQRPDTRANGLAELLGLDKSSVSRIVAGLEDRGLIRVEQGTEDRRERILTLTDAGRTALKEDHETRNAQVAECVEPLPKDDRDRLTIALRRMADAFDAPQGVPMPGEHPAKVEIRRLTRCMGYLGDNFLGSGIAVERFQVLWNIASGKVELSELRALLPYEASSLSRLIQSILKTGLLLRSVDPVDRRRVLLALTEPGRRDIAERRQRAINRLTDVLARTPHDELDTLIRLLSGFLGSVEPEGEGASAYEIREPASESDRMSLRAWVVEELVGRREHFTLGETLLSASNRILYAEIGGRIEGVVEFAPVPDGWVAVTVVLADPSDHGNLVGRFLEFATAVLYPGGPAAGCSVRLPSVVGAAGARR